MRHDFWRKLSQAVNDFKCFEPATLNRTIVTLATEARFVDVSDDDVEEVLASHDHGMTEEEWMKLQEERIQTETKNNSEQPESEVFQGQNEKHCM